VTSLHSDNPLPFPVVTLPVLGHRVNEECSPRFQRETGPGGQLYPPSSESASDLIFDVRTHTVCLCDPPDGVILRAEALAFM
jgi:hypothetical protein